MGRRGHDVAEILELIRNDCFMVRHYSSSRTEAARLRRHQAILKLWADLHFAYKQSDDPEAVLAELLDGLRPRDIPPF